MPEDVRDDTELLESAVEHMDAGASGETPEPQTTPAIGAPATDFPQARRGMARLLKRSGRCPVYAPGGMRCPACGKIHDL